MITVSDAIIVAGAATSLVGCWLLSLEVGLIGSGVVMCLAGRVAYGVSKRSAR